MSSAGLATLLDWNKQFELSLDPERAKEYHDETLPADIYKQAGSARCAVQALPDADQDHR